jgi:aerobic-type carbon monoxide dehydrogenase small subunit (CoxS/CutS family)
MRHAITVNGARTELTIDPGERLLRVLRDRLGLTGAKEACGLGECGACTVLIGGRPRQACITLAATVEDEVLTVEGLAEADSGLRVAFAEHGGFQCGFCTPGQLMSARALLNQAADCGAAAERSIR